MKYFIAILLIINYAVADNFNLQIKKGWNLLSIPIEENLKASKLGNFNDIWIYEDEWIKNPVNINYSVGFWLKSDDNYNISFLGDSYEVDFTNLKDGWSLLGAGSDINLTKSNFKTFTYKDKWIKNPSTIKRGMGFWVKNLIDDWKELEVPTYDSYNIVPINTGYPTTVGNAIPMATTAPIPMSTPLPLAVSADSGSDSSFEISTTEGEIGFSVGGAKDIGNFRENIENSYLPLPSDITYEGLFYDYSFNTGMTKECNELFCPSYTKAVTNDPFSQNEELYLSVGLNSGITNFQRKKLNLVVVLDISGSMNSSFDSYYYDGEYLSESKSKMALANESIANMTKHLKDSDKFGVVLFDDSGYLAKPLNLVANTNMDKIREHILEISTQGGTNMFTGLDLGFSLFEDIDSNISEYENRVIFLTDAMPNLGVLNENSLANKISQNSDKGIFTTFIGVGVDFNSELIEFMTKTEGANYYSIHNSNEFKKRLDEEFDFMVTPLVFNLQLTLKSDKYSIEKVFGTPEANETTGEIMRINTLFPSKSVNRELKGGIVLIKLKKESNEGEDDLNLTVSYRDRSYIPHVNSEIITFNSGEEYFENSGIQKGVLLTRYANLLKNWIIEDRKHCQNIEEFPLMNLLPPPWIEYADIGIPIPKESSTWERTSCELIVSSKYKDIFSTFRDYFISENEILNDEELKQELGVLESLIEY